MSKISQDFIGNVGHLYEQINTYDQDFLNEESEYYDKDLVELVEDIFSTVSSLMIHEGYSASATIAFLADGSEEEISEKYLSYDEKVILESVVSHEYVEEQTFIINEAIGSALRLLGRGIASAVKPAGRIVKTATKRALGPAGRKKISQAVTKVKDIAKGAKAALPGVAKGALAAGLGVLAGYGGAKLGSGGQTKAGKPEPTSTDGGAVKDLTAYRAGGGGAKSRKTGMTTREIEDLGRQNIARKPPEAPKLPAPASPSATSTRSSKPSAPKPKQPEKKPSGGAERRTPTTAELKAAQTARETALKAGKSKSEAEKAAVQAGVDRGTKLMGGPEGPGEINRQEVEASIKAQQERDKKRAQSSTQKESYDAYDFVLSYLMENGHADTIDEAHYLMLEMDSKMVGNIISLY
jgi:hypothetical protein